MIQWQARHTKTKKPLPLSYLFAFLLAMGSFPAACFLLSFLTHIQRSPTVLPLSSLFLIQHVGAHGVEWQQLLSSLLKRCHRNVHLEAVKEGLFHAKWECAWSEERLGGLCWCSLPPPPPPPSSSLLFLSTFTNTRTHLQARSLRSTPTCCLLCAQLATLSNALWGRVWRQEESGEIEMENEDEEVEDVDICDARRKKR